MEQAESITLDQWNLPGTDLERQNWDVPPQRDRRVEGKFRQNFARSGTSVLFRLFNGHFLAIKRHQRKKALPEQVIDLTFVEPRPREVKYQGYGLWFVAVCLLTVPAFTYSLVPLPASWLLAPLLAGVALMVVAARLRKHRFDFLALNSDVVLFSVDATVSDEATVTALVEAVCRAIALGQRQLPDGKRRLPLAVTEMRRLSRDGVITVDQYETIKGAWFAL